MTESIENQATILSKLLFFSLHLIFCLYVSHIASLIVPVCLSLCITLIPSLSVSYLSVFLSLNISSDERANDVQQT